MKEEAMGKSKKEAEQSAAKKLFLSGFFDTWQNSL
jgi:dsRNA-specific ribonuclease